MSHTAAVLTISDRCSRGQRADASGPAIRRILEENGWEVVHTGILPDDRERIQAALIDCGALGASMSGSGPSVFGLFHREDLAQEALERLRSSYRDVFLCGPAGAE